MNREVIVSTGVNVDLAFRLKVATVEETITVTAETPVVDTKKSGTRPPSPRTSCEDPERARPLGRAAHHPRRPRGPREHRRQRERPAVLLRGQGLGRQRHQWTLDGVVITDMAATGASPTYFDYDAFEEINVTTGGTDVKTATGGVGINFVTKRGTNTFHGSRARLPHATTTSSRATCPRGLARSERRPDTRLRTPTAATATRPTTSSRSPTTASTSAARSSRTSSGSGAPTASRTSGSSASPDRRTRRCSRTTTPR